MRSSEAARSLRRRSRRIPFDPMIPAPEMLDDDAARVVCTVTNCLQNADNSLTES